VGRRIDQAGAQIGSPATLSDMTIDVVCAIAIDYR